MKELARNVGFAIHVRSFLLYELTWQDERDIHTTYTGIPGNMLKHEYNVSGPLEDGAERDQAAFWTATKRKAVPT